MSRIARVVVAGFPHHVTQRGNRGSDIFVDSDDRRAYLDLLTRYGAKHGLGVWAYCLMTNHVHLVVVPKNERALGRALHDAHTVYGMRFSRKVGERGHVWQGRFYSCPLDDTHLWAAVRYIERNPVRAGLVERAPDYPWSSAWAHCGLGTHHVLSPGFPPPGVIEDWAAWLGEEDDAISQEIRARTRTGGVCGSQEFVQSVQDILGRIVRSAKRGRKPKPRP